MEGLPELIVQQSYHIQRKVPAAYNSKTIHGIETKFLG